jgi:hypothetical protein
MPQNVHKYLSMCPSPHLKKTNSALFTSLKAVQHKAFCVMYNEVISRAMNIHFTFFVKVGALNVRICFSYLFEFQLTFTIFLTFFIVNWTLTFLDDDIRLAKLFKSDQVSLQARSFTPILRHETTSKLSLLLEEEGNKTGHLPSYLFPLKVWGRHISFCLGMLRTGRTLGDGFFFPLRTAS